METGIKRASIGLFTRTTRKRAAIVAMTGAAVAAGLVLAGPAGASPLAARPAAVGGTEHFQIISTSVTSSKASVILYGAFGAAGVDHQSSSHAVTATDLIVLPGGSFKLTHTARGGTDSLDTSTCVYTAAGAGIYRLSGGTGKYKGISGHGTFRLSVIGLGPRLKSGKCNLSQNAVSVAQQTVIVASGPMRIR